MTAFKKDLTGMTFGQLLRHYRIKHLMTIGELARISSVSKSYISMLEHGVRRPGLSGLRRLVTALRLDGEDFHTITEAALCNAPPFMCERDGPDRPEMRSRAEKRYEAGVCATTMNVPPPSAQEAEFLRRAQTWDAWTKEQTTDVHPQSPKVTDEYSAVGKVQA